MNNVVWDTLAVSAHYYPALFLPTLGVGELALIFVIVLVIFGPGKLPQAAKALGDALRQFKQASQPVPPPTSEAAPTSPAAPPPANSTASPNGPTSV
jgi:sec-independent protein translocase protein TatA